MFGESCVRDAAIKLFSSWCSSVTPVETWMDALCVFFLFCSSLGTITISAVTGSEGRMVHEVKTQGHPECLTIPTQYI